MHEAQMLKRQGKKIREIAESLGKSERMVHYYLTEPSRPRKNGTIRASSTHSNPTLILYPRMIPRSIGKSCSVNYESKNTQVA